MSPVSFDELARALATGMSRRKAIGALTPAKPGSDERLDTIARALATPMSRRRAVRLLAATVAGAAIPTLWPRPAASRPAQRRARSSECDFTATRPGSLNRRGGLPCRPAKGDAVCDGPIADIPARQCCTDGDPAEWQYGYYCCEQACQCYKGTCCDPRSERGIGRDGRPSCCAPGLTWCGDSKNPGCCTKPDRCDPVRGCTACEECRVAVKGGGKKACCYPPEKCCFTDKKAACCGPGQKCHNGSCNCPKTKPVRCGSECCKKSQYCCAGHCCDTPCCGDTCCPKKQPCCVTAAGKRCCPDGQFCAQISGAPGNKNCCPTERIATPNGVPVCCPTGMALVSGPDGCCPPSNPTCCSDPNVLGCLRGSLCVNGECIKF